MFHVIRKYATSFNELNKYWPDFDGFVHSIGFAPAEQLKEILLMSLQEKVFKLPMILVLTVLLLWQKLQSLC